MLPYGTVENIAALQHPLWPTINFIIEHPLPVAIGFIVFVTVFTWVWKKPLAEWYIINRGQQIPSIKSLRQQAWTNLSVLEWKEDIYPIVQRPQKLAQNPIIQKFTWQKWTKILTLITIIHLLTPLAEIPHEYGYLAVTGIILILWLGILKHTRSVNMFRKQIMQQMFDVAASEMRYPSGAEQVVSGYIQVQEWEYVYTPLTTVIMYPPKYRSDSEANREHFQRAFNAVVSDQHTWKYDWEPSNNKVTATPVPYIPEQAALPFPDNKPYNIIPLGITLGNEEVEVDLNVAPHALILGTTGSGKDLTLDTPIPVPVSEKYVDGWATMGMLNVGDHVFDEKGSPCRIFGVSEILQQNNLYEVTFSDGTTIRAGKDHMWWTQHYSTNRQPPDADSRITPDMWQAEHRLFGNANFEQEVTLQEFARTIGLPENSHAISQVSGQVGHIGEITFTSTKTLGDEENTPSSVLVKTYSAEELFSAFTSHLSAQTSSSHKNFWQTKVCTTEDIFHTLSATGEGLSNYSVATAGALNLPETNLPASPHVLGNAIKEHNRHRLNYTTSHDCHGSCSRIPAIFLRSSQMQREELLSALDFFPQDQHRQGKETVDSIYCTEKLALDVQELLLSLGYIATVTQETLNSSHRWKVSVSGNASSRYIVDVRRIAAAETKCIQVDSPKRLFLAGKSMIPTHNSVTQRTILLHCLQNPDWRIILIDPKRVELSMYKNAENVVEVATELETMVESIAKVETMMHARYTEMEEAGVNHFLSLPDPPPAVMLMVDETFALLAPEGIKSDEGKERDALHAQAAMLIGSIARLGRAAGVHLVLATQRPDAKVIPGELRNNLDCRIAQGRMISTASLMALDGDQATRLPKVKGRAMVRVGNEYTEFQAYFVPPDDVDKAIVVCNALALGHLTPEDLLGTGATEADVEGGGLRQRVAKVVSSLKFWKRFKKDEKDNGDDDGYYREDYGPVDYEAGTENMSEEKRSGRNFLGKIPGVSHLVSWCRKREESLGEDGDEAEDAHLGRGRPRSGGQSEDYSETYYDEEEEDDSEEEASPEDLMRMIAELEDDEDEEEDGEGTYGNVREVRPLRDVKPGSGYDDYDDDYDEEYDDGGEDEDEEPYYGRIDEPRRLPREETEHPGEHTPRRLEQHREYYRGESEGENDFRDIPPRQVSVSAPTSSPGGVKFTVSLDAPDVEVLKSSLFLKEIISMYGIAGQPIPFTEFLSALEQEISSLEEAERQLENRSPNLTLDGLKPAEAEVPPPGGWEIYDDEEEEEEEPSTAERNHLSAPTRRDSSRDVEKKTLQGSHKKSPRPDSWVDVDEEEAEAGNTHDRAVAGKEKSGGRKNLPDEENHYEEVEEEEDVDDDEEFLLEVERLRAEADEEAFMLEGDDLTGDVPVIGSNIREDVNHLRPGFDDAEEDEDDEEHEDASDGDYRGDDEKRGWNPAENSILGFFDGPSQPASVSPVTVKDNGDEDADGWENDDDWDDDWIEEANARKNSGFVFGQPVSNENASDGEGTFDSYYSTYMTLLDQEEPKRKKKKKQRP